MQKRKVEPKGALDVERRGDNKDDTATWRSNRALEQYQQVSISSTAAY